MVGVTGSIPVVSTISFNNLEIVRPLQNRFVRVATHDQLSPSNRVTHASDRLSLWLRKFGSKKARIFGQIQNFS